MSRRGAASIAANPVLIGAATTLVVIVAVFLAYNANNGLPFVPTYDLDAEVPERGEPRARQRGAHRRLARRRRRRDRAAARGATARSTRVLNLKLETAVEPLPRDSTILVRPRSALGLKYVEITQGRRRAQGFEAGATIPLAQRDAAPGRDRRGLLARSTSRRARRSRTNLDEFGGALAGRGQSTQRRASASARACCATCGR